MYHVGCKSGCQILPLAQAMKEVGLDLASYPGDAHLADRKVHYHIEEVTKEATLSAYARQFGRAGMPFAFFRTGMEFKILVCENEILFVT